jgi:hypothetical protein
MRRAHVPGSIRKNPKGSTLRLEVYFRETRRAPPAKERRPVVLLFGQDLRAVRREATVARCCTAGQKLEQCAVTTSRAHEVRERPALSRRAFRRNDPNDSVECSSHLPATPYPLSARDWALQRSFRRVSAKSKTNTTPGAPTQGRGVPERVAAGVDADRRGVAGAQRLDRRS